MNSRWRLTDYNQFVITVERMTPMGKQVSFAYNVPIMWDYYQLDMLDRTAAKSVLSVGQAQDNARIKKKDAQAIADKVFETLLDY